MLSFETLQQSSEITHLLKGIKSVAIVGLSPKEQRPSNMVGRYLQGVGYTIYPVNPGQTEILGEVCYPDINALPCSVDLINIFRKSDDVPAIVEQVLEMDPLPKAIWMQQGIVNERAAAVAGESGIFVVMDRCIKVDHANFLQQ